MSIGDVLEILGEGWDMVVAHPPCTYLCVSGNRSFKEDESRNPKRELALEFVRILGAAPIKRIAIENPTGVISTRLRKPDQIIQPYQFGHAMSKATCLWLKNLPPLLWTNLVTPEISSHAVFRNWKDRSRTFDGIAQAMAKQWGRL